MEPKKAIYFLKTAINQSVFNGLTPPQYQQLMNGINEAFDSLEKSLIVPKVEEDL